ncbi:MAG: ATP-binding protein [Anaerolineales bacterium]|nr:ATP-binding protein [Anaerolineales bacterium]
MTEVSEKRSGTQVLRPRARILRTFGDELISSETVAIIELVKNAYDADATRVLIHFEPPLEKGQGRIDVLDNGHGMALETVQEAWMEPATLYRKQKNFSEVYNRRVLGEKGIGRFAASRLADSLEVYTRRINSLKEVCVFFDWSQFDKQDIYLDEVEILWEESEPAIFCANGIAKKLWNEWLDISSMDTSHGTLLRMENLRQDWDKEQITELRRGLTKLVFPFSVSDTTHEKTDFQIILQTPFEDLSGSIQPAEVLMRPHYILQGEVDKLGAYKLNILIGKPDKPHSKEGKFALKNNREPQCGPFNFEFRVWDRDQEILGELASRIGSTIGNIRRELNLAAGISIYRDGFRVMPYGEPNNDWLRLDLRRVQNPTKCLSNNQIVGYLIISADQNPSLRDQSNREGLIAGQALEDLEEIVRSALAILEEERFKVRPRREQKAAKGGIFTEFSIATISKLVKERYPEDKDLLDLIAYQESDLDRRVEQVQDVLARYRRLATLGQLIDTVLHDGRTPLSKIGRQAYLGKRDTQSKPKDSASFVQKLDERFDTIFSQSDVLETLFRKIEPFGGRKRGRPVEKCLEEVITNTFSVLDAEIRRKRVKVKPPIGDTRVTVDESELQQVFINLLQNSLYWLEKIPEDARKIVVQVKRLSDDNVEVIFSDSGPGIAPDIKDFIFEPYFSTKPDGVGLGLTIAGEIISEYYDGSLELLNSGPLSGATFRILLRRRV